MNELFPTAKALLTWMIGIIGTLLGLLGAVALGFIRNHMKAHYVTKEDLAEMRADMSADRQRMHDENQKKLNSIELAVTGTHKRMDDLYRDLIQR